MVAREIAKLAEMASELERRSRRENDEDSSGHSR
jgi:hypothetical protein